MSNKYNFINNYTGAVYTTFSSAIKSAFSQYNNKKFPQCHTLKIFNITKLK